jgi:hypothetical protein
MKSRLLPRNSTKRLAGSRIRLVGLLGAGTLGCFLFLAGCGEEPQALEERITQMQKELDRTQGELQSTTQALQASKDELARLKGSTPSTKRDVPSSPATTSITVSRETLEASYMAEAKTLKKQLQSQLKDFTLGSFTLHNVQLPDSQFPVTSWISLAFEAGDGKQFRLDYPVKADAKGGWVFPDLAEIVRRAAEAKKIVATTTPPPSTESKTTTTDQQPNVPKVMPSSGTVVIQWPTSPAPAPPQNTTKNSEPTTKQNPAPTSPRPETAPSQGPKQNIPADRDVLIRF